MKRRVRDLFAARESSDRDAAYRALVDLFAMAKDPVDWAYDVWDQMVEDLGHKEGSKRAFAAQMLAHLAISDPEDRMLDDLPTLAAVMRDDKTVTARHTGITDLAEKLMAVEKDEETRAKQRAGWRKATTPGTNAARHDRPRTRRS